MRLALTLALALAHPLALGPPLAAAAEDFVVLLDWTSGESAVGVTALAPAAPGPLGHVLLVDVDACHPRLLLDLLYDPAELVVEAQGVGEASLAYRYHAQAWQDGALLAEREIASSGYGHHLALATGKGEVEVRFWLTEGADVSWDARIRGRLAVDDPACQDPL